MPDNKTIGITLRFWTNDLEVKHKGLERIVCWDSGVGYIEANAEKGIAPQPIPTPFNTMDEVIILIKELLRQNRVLVVSHGGKPRLLSAQRGKRSKVV